MLTQRQLILSSSSPARRGLLSRLQIPFLCVSPDVDESPLPGEIEENLVTRVSLLKAQASAERYPEALIIGADTLGTLNHQALTKPLTYENAVRQLQLMSGKIVRFYTGLCLLDAKSGNFQESVEIFDVHFRHLSDAMIENYLRQEDVLQCAGSVQVEGLGITLIEKLVGDDYTALIGLPLIRLTGMLMKVAA